MQFKRNRRLMLAQDIVLVLLIPILCFFCIGSLQIGSWNTGDMFELDLSASELAEDWISDFYADYSNANGDELGDPISFSPFGIWKSLVNGVIAILGDVLSRPTEFSGFSDLSAPAFDQAAGLLVIFHLIVQGFKDTIFLGFIYLALFATAAITPLVMFTRAVYALPDLIAHRNDRHARHRLVVLGFRRAIRPLFALLLFSLFIPEVRLSEIWLWAMGIYLVCVIWNFIASRVKRNTGNEKEFLNFVQFFSMGGVVLMAAAVIALERSGILRHLYERIFYADGLDIILDLFSGDFDIMKFIVVGFVAMVLAGVGLMVRYVYYGLLRVACLFESSAHKKAEHEGMVALTAVALGFLGSSYFLFEAKGRQELVLEEQELIAFFVCLGLILLTLIVEILQRVFCHVNRLDREYRNDLLCGRTDDRYYSIEAAIADGSSDAAEDAGTEETAEELPVEEAPAEETPAEEAPAEETPAEEAPAEEAPAEETPAEEVPAEEAPAEETPAEETPAEEAPTEEAPAEEAPAEEAPAEETPAEEAPAEETPAEEAPAKEAPAEESLSE